MNVANIFKLADVIEKDGEFSMLRWSGCIAGLCARRLVPAAVQKGSFFYGPPKLAMICEFLGLDAKTGMKLFRLNADGVSPLADEAVAGAITPEQAARVLRNLAILGKVDWDAALKEPADPTDLPKVPERGPAWWTKASATTYTAFPTPIYMAYTAST